MTQQKSPLANYRLGYEELEKDKGKPIKSLTNGERSGTISSVKKKGRQLMVRYKNKNIKIDFVKGSAWLVEAGFRVFVGLTLLNSFSGYTTTLAALYALGTAALIVVSHFIKAHN